MPQHTCVIRVPAGLCPIGFGHLWDFPGGCPPDAVIIAWFWEVRDAGLRKGHMLTAEAIAYWARTAFDSLTHADAYHHVGDVIRDYAEAIGDEQLRNTGQA